MKKILFEITTPEQTLVKDEIDSLTCMTREGEVTILPGHVPLVVPIAPGALLVRKGDQEISLMIAGGFLQVDQATDDIAKHIGSRVSILADAAERVEEIDIERAERARAHAQEAMAAYRGKDLLKFAEASSAFERAAARLRVAERKRAPRRSPSVQSQ